MLLYEDILTGDELFSDAFPLYVQQSLPIMLAQFIYQERNRRHCL